MWEGGGVRCGREGGVEVEVWEGGRRIGGVIEVWEGERRGEVWEGGGMEGWYGREGGGVEGRGVGGKENGVEYSYKHNTLFLGLQLLYSFPCVIEKEVNKVR